MIAHLNGVRVPHHVHDPRYKMSGISEELRRILNRYPAGGFYSKMTEQEALLVLSIEGDDIMSLTKEKLREKHRKAMIANHPDKGGSPYIAMKINEARDTLEHSYMFRKR